MTVKTGARGLRPLLALVCALVLVAAACGNEESDDTAATTAAPDGEDGDEEQGPAEPFGDLVVMDPPEPCEPSPGVSDDQVEVGLLYSATGEQAQSFQPAVDGVQARFERANAEGGIGGRELVLVEGDDASDAARNTNAARTLVERDEVFGVISVSSNTAEATGEYFHEQGVPVVGWHVGVPIWGEYENMFGFWHSQSPEPGGLPTTRQTELFAELGGDQVALVGINNQSSVAFLDQVEEALSLDPSIEVVYRTNDVAPGETVFTAISDQIGSSGANAMYTGMDFQQNVALNEQLSNDGHELDPTFFPGGYDGRVTGIPGMQGAIIGLEFAPFELELPAHEQFMEDMGDRFPSQVAMSGYLSADLMIRGLEEAGAECPTREVFVNNLRLVDDYAAGGLLPEAGVDFSQIFGHMPLCFYYVQLVDEEFQPLFDGEPFCGLEIVDGEPVDVPGLEEEKNR